MAQIHAIGTRVAIKSTMMILKNSRGQSATEYMLILAVVVMALVAVASRFVEPFQAGVSGLAANISEWLSTNQSMTKAGE